MKKFFFIVTIVAMLSTVLLFSCDNNEGLQTTTNTESPAGASQKKEFHIVYADWDGWGRTSRECRGWGLCHFSSCSFCCLENGVIVSCNDRVSVPNSGTFIIDKETKQGHLIITLDPTIEIQKEAIDTRAIFYIDDELQNDGLAVKKGEYAFDSTVGQYGGYKLNAYQI